MPFCQHCGGEITALPEAVAAEAMEPVEVQLARIAKEQAVEVARIQASATRAELASAETVAEIVADGQVETAEAVAEIMTADDEPADEPGPEPIVIDAPTAEVDDMPDDAPPPAADDHQPHERAKSKGLGFW